MRILQITRKVPAPLHDGESIAIQQLIRYISTKNIQIDLFSLNTSKHFYHLEKEGDSSPCLVHYKNIDLFNIDNRTSYLSAFKSIFQPLPYHVFRLYSEIIVNKLDQKLTNDNYDVILIESTLMMIYISQLKANVLDKSLIVLRSHNLEYEVWKRQGQIEKYFLKRLFINFQANKLRRFEHQMYQLCNLIWAISPRDSDRIRNETAGLKVIPIPVGIDNQRTFYKKRDQSVINIGYIGSLDWMPNISGLAWFIRLILPYLNTTKIEIHIAGKNGKASAFVNNPNLHYHAEVPDSSSFISSLDLMIVPLFSGSGVRIKLLEAISLGTPILCTALACEGIAIEDNVHAWISDHESEWIERINSLSEKKSELEGISNNARDYIRINHNPETIALQAINSLNEALRIKSTSDV